MRVPFLLCLALSGPAALAATAEFQFTDGRGTPVADAVVSVRPADGRPLPVLRPTPDAMVVQENQELVPYVTAITVGTTLSLPNRDKVEHHAYSLSPALKFDLPLYKPGANHALAFKLPGVVTIGCNIHDWMIAYVVVLDTPWFAKSPGTGEVALPGLPAGRYTATIWHPRLAAPVTRDLTLEAQDGGTRIAMSLSLRPDRRIRRPAAATGEGYR